VHLIVLWSFCSESVRTLSFAAVGQYSDPALLKSAFALQRLPINLGASIGPLVGGFLARNHFTWLFYIDAATSFVAAFLLYRFLPRDASSAPAPDAPIGTVLTAALRALSDRRLVAINLVLLPVDIGLPVFGEMLSVAANGWLLGREYFEMVAMRHLPAEEARRLRKAHMGYVSLCGLIIAGLASVPILNLLTPLFATAFMVRIYKQLALRAGVARVTAPRPA